MIHSMTGFAAVTRELAQGSLSIELRAVNSRYLEVHFRLDDSLRALEPGDMIEVTREDGSTAVFAVDRGEQYGKDDFPTLEVYGNTEGSELRLITCDGFDPATGEFDDNYVVYASLVP